MIKLNIKKLFTLGLAGLFLIGCASPGVPYTYINTYENEILPKIDSSMLGTNTISGSSFLRQNGGGIVNCAGNEVTLTKNVNLGIERNAYAKEYLALSAKDRAVTQTDPRLIQFENDLQGIRDSQVKRTVCDVDGKFKFTNVSPGTYSIKTKVFWVVMDRGQGGIMGATVVVPEGADNQEYSSVVNTITRRCLYSWMC